MGKLGTDAIDQIHIVGRVVGTFSFLGSISIICCYIAFPALRKLAFTLVLFMSIADVMAAVGDFLAPDGTRCSTCLAQAYLNSIFDLSSVLWTSCITHCLYRAIRHRDAEVYKYQTRYHAFSWGVPILLAIVPQFANAYGLENGRCWIMSTYPSIRFLQFYVPLWLVISYNFAHIVLLMRHLYALTHRPSTADSSQVRGEVQFFWRLALYPVVLVVCWTPGTINRIHNSVRPDNPVYGLYMAQAIMGSSQGLFNSLVYGLSPGVRAHLSNAFKKLLGKVGVRSASAVGPDGPDELELSKLQAENGENEAGDAQLITPQKV